jgi:hypothetical protein
MKKEYNEYGCRELLCAIIEQAVEDIQNETDYKYFTKKYDAYLAKDSAIKFFKSKGFKSICEMLNIHCVTKIKTEVFK